LRSGRDIAGRFHTQYRYVAGQKVLQQVTVVAGDFNDLTVRPERKAVDDRQTVLTGVLNPAVCIRGEIAVFAKDLLGRDELLELNQEAALTDIRMQRVEGLHAVQLFGADVRLTQG